MDFQQQQGGATISQQAGTALAPQACAPCRRQKRRCDKQVPSCSLCLRIGRPCDYSAESQPQAPSSEEFAALRQQVSDLQHLLTSNGGNNGHLPSPNGSNDVHPFGINNSNGNGNAYDNANSPFKISAPATPINPLSDAAPTPAPLWPAPSSFPSLFFLDSNYFEHERQQIQAPHVKLPPGALTALGNSGDLRGMIEHYFATVHNHLPIISKIRLYQHLAHPLHEPGADIALLFLSMKLACSSIPQGMPAQSQQLYQDVKSFTHYLTSQNLFTIPVLQAHLLLALYELGHGIYPAAYLSVGAAARLGYAAGLHDRKAPQMLPRCNTWTEQEERRRLWWGIVVLDRFVNIGSRFKPFASTDPGVECHLPTDDASWDRGQMLVAAPLSLSASPTIRVAPFARTCQAAHILGKVLRHVNDKSLPDDYRFNEALQLHRTIRALADVLRDEAEDGESDIALVSPSMGTTYSGLLALYEGYSCTENWIDTGLEEQLVMQKESIDALSSISSRIVDLSRKIRTIVEAGGMERLSPLVVDCLYQAAANYAWYVRESSDPTCGARLAELKELLLVLDRRWKVAGEYYRIIEASEFQHSTGGG